MLLLLLAFQFGMPFSAAGADDAAGLARGGHEDGDVPMQVVPRLRLPAHVVWPCGGAIRRPCASRHAARCLCRVRHFCVVLRCAQGVSTDGTAARASALGRKRTLNGNYPKPGKTYPSLQIKYNRAIDSFIVSVERSNSDWVRALGLLPTVEVAPLNYNAERAKKMAQWARH